MVRRREENVRRRRGGEKEREGIHMPSYIHQRTPFLPSSLPPSLPPSPPSLLQVLRGWDTAHLWFDERLELGLPAKKEKDMRGKALLVSIQIIATTKDGHTACLGSSIIPCPPTPTKTDAARAAGTGGTAGAGGAGGAGGGGGVRRLSTVTGVGREAVASDTITDGWFNVVSEDGSIQNTFGGGSGTMQGTKSNEGHTMLRAAVTWGSTSSLGSQVNRFICILIGLNMTGWRRDKGGVWFAVCGVWCVRVCVCCVVL